MVEKVKPDPWNLSVNTGVGKQKLSEIFDKILINAAHLTKVGVFCFSQ
ncbi:hypothetical protein Ccel_1993 [Ruminiclostridium cellulolyticum H10]|uniref:Uncharacterized protein n=1 Tax=Ruminiclostridium cellulolyticum (strain ATCC 35319 / DSM 5812 / JCM 6584 / H10) TaxID=394503 RepID=B8I3J8_RUMCH|nr:hypothetical protein Ccel_1993 [Ruminiclostridium cellulolyticum H10]